MQASVRLCDDVAEVVKAGNSFVLATASPDGDAVGSMVAFALALKNHDKEASVYLPEALPDNLAFLPGLDLITYNLPAQAADALLIMDTGSSRQLLNGDKNAWRKIGARIVDIDHHPDNDRYGDVNLVIPEAASTGEIVFRVLSHLGWEVDSRMAACLLTALMSDTGVFRYPNVTPFTYMIASELLGKGLDNGKIARNIYSTCTIPYVKLMGRMLGNLQFDLDGKVAWSVLAPEDFKAAGAADDDADKMVEQLDMLNDVKAYALLRQVGNGVVKVSLRSRDDLPVNKIAQQHGGGGHRQAAGCRLTGDLREAEKKIVEGLRSLFK